MTLRQTLLGLLTVRPSTGYELKAMFDGSVRHFWTADQAQIYRELAKLVEDGRAVVEVVPHAGKPDRRVHTITAHGEAELDEWLLSPLAQQPVREPFLAQVFFAGRLSRDDVLWILDRRTTAARGVLEQLSAVRVHASTHTAPALDEILRLATLDNGIRHVETEIAWLTDLTSTISATQTEGTAS
jgi:PadR family transcriptional regulator, regulatory protein AphA